jgi:hypothetical protein
MSGVVKGVKKTFKKVVKTVAKVAPIALAGAAVLFTAGSALGVTAGWGSVAGGLSSTLGLTQGSTLSNVLTGAVTQAGYGAAIGAATSALTGGDVADGALLGAAGGAVTGGVTGAIGLNPDPLAPSSTAPSGSAATAPTPTMETLTAPSVTGEPGIGGVGPSIAQTTSAPASSGAGIFDNGGWLERNQNLVGGVVAGVGRGLLAGMGDKAQIEAAERRRKQTQANYRTSGRGLMPDERPAEAAYDASGNPSPSEKYPATVEAPQGRPFLRYVYNRETGRMELVRMG